MVVAARLRHVSYDLVQELTGGTGLADSKKVNPAPVNPVTRYTTAERHGAVASW
jgi:hypothetical protein